MRHLHSTGLSLLSGFALLTSLPAYADEISASDIVTFLSGMGSDPFAPPQNMMVWRANIAGIEHTGHAAYLDLPAMAPALQGDEALPRIILSMDPMGWDNPMGGFLGGLAGALTPGDLAGLPDILSLSESAIVIALNVPGELTPSRLPVVMAEPPPPNSAVVAFYSPLNTQEHYAGHATQGEVVITNVDGGLRGQFAAPMRYGLYDENDRDMSGLIAGEFCQIGMDAMQRAIEEGRDVAWGSVPCLYQDDTPLQVVDNQPRHGRENVLPDRATLHVAFSTPVARAEVEEHLEVFTRDPAGDRMVADGTIERTGRRSFEFIPDPALEVGAIYEARITGGDEGIENRAGNTLAADFWWRFSTLIDLETAEMEVSFYQTMRDAPLVRTKPTLSRVFLDWQERPDIHPNWQPLSFPATIRPWNQRDGWMYPADFDRVFRIERPDQHTPIDRRMAFNTSNLFDWRPTQARGEVEVEVELEPHDPYPDDDAPPIMEDDFRIAMWPYEPRTVSMAWYLLPVGPWAGGVPADERVAAGQTVWRASEFATQTMPILGMNTVGGSVLETSRVSDEGKPIDTIVDTLMALQWEVIDRGVAEILLLLTPLDWHPYGSSISAAGADAQWFEVEDPGAEGLRWLGSVIQAPISPALSDSSALTHEIGHGFGLGHTPDTDCGVSAWLTPAADPSDIEGFRISLGGRFGWNKSYRDGNAEHPGRLHSLMHPCARPAAETFMRYQDYHTLQSVPYMRRFASLGGTRQGGFGDDRIDYATPSPDMIVARMPKTDVGTWLRVIGRLDPDGGARIDTVRPVPRGYTTPEGALTALLRDAEGTVVERVSFGPIGDVEGAEPADPATWPLFTAVLPGNADARRLEIRRGDELLAARDRRAAPPELTVEGLQPQETLDGPALLTWSVASDAEATYTVLFSPDGRAPWRFLAVGRDRTELSLDPADLTPGPAPTLRIIANDGFNETRTDIEIVVVREPEPSLTRPVSGTTASDMVEVQAVFDVAMDSDSFIGRFDLHDADGQAVDAGVRYEPTLRAVLLTPEERLEPDADYTATLRAGVADAFGNRLETDISWEFRTGAALPVREHHDVFETLPGGPPPTPGRGRSSVEPPDPDRRHADATSRPAEVPEQGEGPSPHDGVLVLEGRTLAFVVDQCLLEAATLGLTEIRGTGTDPDTGETFQVTAQRVDMSGGLMDSVTVRLGGDQLQALRTRSNGQWRDRAGGEAGSLLVAEDGRFAAAGLMAEQGQVAQGQAGTRPFSLTAHCQ